MEKPTKEYIVWVYSDGGYHPTEHDTVEEALLQEKYGSTWYLTKSINSISAYGGFDKPKKDVTKN